MSRKEEPASPSQAGRTLYDLAPPLETARILFLLMEETALGKPIDPIKTPKPTVIWSMPSIRRRSMGP